MDKIKILVACHKPWKVYQDDVYTPIHVGRAVSECKDEMADMTGDDSGDHISGKNATYAEMTAQYWAWKNLHDVEYIGFCHYRRYFDVKFTFENVDKIFQKNDVIVVNERVTIPIIMDSFRWINREDITLFMIILKKKYPEYERAALDYLWSIDWHSRNMLVCRKEVFDQYAAWMFDILSECEKYIKAPVYISRSKTLAYLSELFMPVYFIHHGFRMKSVGIVECPDEKRRISLRTNLESILRKWHHNLFSWMYYKPTSFENYYESEVLAGLKMDGILP